MASFLAKTARTADFKKKNRGDKEKKGITSNLLGGAAAIAKKKKWRTISEESSSGIHRVHHRTRSRLSSLDDLDLRDRIGTVRNVHVQALRNEDWSKNLDKNINELFNMLCKARVLETEEGGEEVTQNGRGRVDEKVGDEEEHMVSIKIDGLTKLSAILGGTMTSVAAAKHAMETITGIPDSTSCDIDMFQSFVTGKLIHLKDYAPKIVEQWTRELKEVYGKTAAMKGFRVMKHIVRNKASGANTDGAAAVPCVGGDRKKKVKLVKKASVAKGLPGMEKPPSKTRGGVYENEI